MLQSMLGALVGDAAGATLEFYHGEITEEIAEKAMKMPGGGSLRVGAGQITDDGELTLTLWQSLINSKLSEDIIESLHLELLSEEDHLKLALMKGYTDWYESCPFDIGRTCSLAFETYCDFFIYPRRSTLEDCTKNVFMYNKSSEANGALMRATAIATWAVQNSKDVMIAVKFAMLDAELSHPNIICQETNAIYVFAIIHLLRGKTPEEVISLTNDFVRNTITSEKVKHWYYTESLDITDMNATTNIGHVRWGFVLAIYFLRNPAISYEDAIKITLMKGGDTDTNAAIVGGIVGAYSSIPDYMLQPVLDFDCTADGFKHHKRPGVFSVKKVLLDLKC
jgi:ADP-ribosylglycohydrolase